MFHRSGVAILLIVTLLLPLGTCRPSARATSHDCCGQQSAPVASLKASCCLLHTEVPAMVVERTGLNDVAFAQPAPSFSSQPPAILIELREARIDPHHSAPPGKSILRI